MLKISGNRAAGRAHLKKGEPCQDAIASYKTEDAACIALADGAGSRRHSHYAAETITQEVCEFIANNFDALYDADDMAGDIYDVCMDGLNKLEHPKEEMACTLLCLAVKNDKLIHVHVGDGMMIHIHEDDAEIVSYPENGEAKNETYFVEETMREDQIRTGRGEVANGTYMLMSDGAMEGLYDRRQQKVAPAAYKIASWMQMADEDIVSQKIGDTLSDLFREKTADDVSLIMLNVEK